MLVLSRKEDETVTITTPSGDEIVITILQAKHGTTSIGFDAPEKYLILRNELIDEGNFSY